MEAFYSSPPPANYGVQVQLHRRQADTYKLWRKYVPFLYDFCATHVLQHGSQTCQFLPTAFGEKLERPGFHVLVGTHSNKLKDFENLSVLELSLPDELNEEPFCADVGCFLEIRHPAEVTKARAGSTKNPTLIASISFNDLLLVDAALPNRSSLVNLTSSSKTGYGLAWTLNDRVFVGLDDGSISLIDAASTTKVWSVADGHSFRAVPNVATCEAFLASGGDDGFVKTWDARTAGGAAISIPNAHGSESEVDAVECVSEYVVSAGWSLSEGVSIKRWDVRCCSEPICVLRDECHPLKDSRVFNLDFCPSRKDVIAAAGGDGVRVWSLLDDDAQACLKKDKDGDQRLLFLHGGHTDKVDDVSFLPRALDDGIGAMCSIAEDNILHVYQPNYAFQ